jgi:hypothetical protein
MDWRDALADLERATPERTLEPILAGMDVGERIALIRPLIRSSGPWSAPWTQLVRERTFQWSNAIAFDERFRRTTEYTPPYTENAHRPLALEIYEKTTRG